MSDVIDTEYDYVQTIYALQLTDEIVTAGIPAPDYINTDGRDGTDVHIFYVTPLSEQDKATLDSVVASHVADFSYVALVVQDQVKTLTGYLNDPNPEIAKVARATIVNALAPKLPFPQLLQINAAIKAQVGK